VGPEVVDQLVGELLKVPARVWREMFAALLQYDDMAELARIHAPTLLVWGDADALVTGDMQDQLAERIAGAESVVYPGVGHTPRWERPSCFASDLASFVARLRPTRPAA
jgi:non-heme chloroperoxidase